MKLKFKIEQSKKHKDDWNFTIYDADSGTWLSSVPIEKTLNESSYVYRMERSLSALLTRALTKSKKITEKKIVND